MATAGVVYLDVLPDMGRFHGYLRSSIRGQSTGLRSVGSAIGRTLALGIGAGIAAAGVVGKLAIDAAIEAEKVSAQTEAALKSTKGAANVTAEEIAQLSTRIQNYSGISDEAVQSSANLLLTFTNIQNVAGKGNDIFDRSVKIVQDMSVALGQDAKSSSIQLGKALNDPIAGITSLSRVGVKFTEETKERIATLVEEGKTLEAQKIILRELTTEFGGSARAFGETAAGQFGIAKEAIGNVLEELGGALLPTVARLGKAVAKFVSTKEFQRWMADATVALEKFAGFMVENVPKVFRVIGAVVDFVKNLFGGLEESTDGVQSTWSKFAKWVKPLWRDIQATIKDVVQIIRILWKDWGDDIMHVVKAAWNFARRGISNSIKAIRNVVKLVLALMKGDWGDAWDAFKNILKLALDAQQAILRLGFEVLKGIFGAALSSLGRLWGNAWDDIKGVLGRAWDSIKRAVGNGVQAVVNFFKGLPGKVLNLIRELPGKMFDIGKSIISRLLEGLKSAPGAIADAVTGMFDFDIKLPSFLPGDGFGAIGTAQGGTAAQMANAAISAIGVPMSVSGYRSPAENAAVGGALNSLHMDASNPAQDISGPPAAMLAIAQWLVGRFGATAREIIHTPLGYSMISGTRVIPPVAAADHYDHVHLADRGGVFKGPGMVGIGGITETVFQPARKVSELPRSGELIAHFRGPIKVDIINGEAFVEDIILEHSNYQAYRGRAYQ